MPRYPTNSLEDIVLAAVIPVVNRAAAAIATAVAEMVAVQLEAELGRATPRQARRSAVAPRARQRVEISKWTADNRARRVPNFVIEATGLETKKEVVAKYGEATFEKGKSLPRAIEAAAVEPKTPKAKGPIVRKKTKAAAA